MEPTQSVSVYLPFSILPESKDWSIGQSYRVKLVLKQSSLSEDGANFTIVDASSMDPINRGKRTMSTEGGYLKNF